MLANRCFRTLSQKGFTLVEVLIAILISGFLLAGLYTSFLAQQESYFVNDRISEMQQNLRAALIRMSNEIRMAGHDPTGNSGAQILMAKPFRFRFEQDITNNAGTGGPDGDCGDDKENVTYGFSSATGSGVDIGENGIADAGAANLGRATGSGSPPSGFDAIANGIVAVGFAYGYETAAGTTIWAVDTNDDGNLNLNLDTNGDGRIDANDEGSVDDDLLDGQTIAAPEIINNIKAVKVWILARSSKPDRDFTDPSTYVVGRNIITPNDSYYHRLLVTTINLRNM